MGIKLMLGDSSIEDNAGSIKLNSDVEIASGSAVVFTDNVLGGSINGPGSSSIQFQAGGSISTTGIQPDFVLGTQGSDIASASEITISANSHNITGTTTIDFISTTGMTPGTVVMLRFNSALTLTNGAGGSGSLYLATGGGDRSVSAGGESWFVLRDISGTLYWREIAHSA